MSVRVDDSIYHDERLADIAFVGHYVGTRWMDVKTFESKDKPKVKRILEMLGCVISKDGKRFIPATAGPNIYTMVLTCACKSCMDLNIENLIRRNQVFMFSERNKHLLLKQSIDYEKIESCFFFVVDPSGVESGCKPITWDYFQITSSFCISYWTST